MRKILFRAKRADNKHWVYGDLWQSHGIVCIAWDINIDGRQSREIVEVIPETVGQYLGVESGTGTMIFEGDIVEDDKDHGVLFYRGFLADPQSDDCGYNIVGNIYDDSFSLAL